MRRSLAIPAALSLACLPAVAAAQSATTTTNVAVQQYQPTPFSDRMLRLDGSGVAPFGELRIGMDVDYAFKPLVLVDQTPGIFQAGAPGPNHNLIEHAVGGTVLASFGLGHRLELGVAVPLLLYQHGEDVPGAAKPATFGLSNPLVGIKFHLGSWRGLGAGATVTTSLPVGSGDVTHDSGFGGTARLFADYRRGPLTFGVRAGFHLHGDRTFYNVDLGNQIDYAAGVSLRLGLRTTLMAEGAGLTSAKSPFKVPEQSPVEALGGLRQRIGHLYLTLAGGPGLVRGYGSPVFRAVAGLTWANRVPDADGDGVDDDHDLCPTVPEDRDGFEDGDGCPDPDNDKDGILDAQDRCPNEPDDNDGFEDVDGCPDLDNDLDGIPDAQDKCPLEPETINGIDDDDGCPDSGPAQVHLGKTEIETFQPIFFDTDRSRVKHAFHNLLGQVALLLKAHPEIGRCAVEGHTDATGPTDWNQRLSIMRAKSVIEFLVKQGVDPNRLVPIGHGEELPWASNETPWGRARNRRVVFHIEGVSTGEEQKTHEREERRQRIRRKREAAHPSATAAPEKTVPAKEKKAPASEQKPAPPTAPPTESDAPAKDSAKEGPVKPGATKPGATKPAVTKPAAPAGEAKTTAPGVKPADELAPRPVTPKPAPAERPKLPAKVPEPAPAADDEADEAPAKKAAAKPSDRAKTPKPARRPVEETDPDRPQSLQELLKLPPR